VLIIEQNALNEIIEHASSLQVKLDAYELLHHILFPACAPKEMRQLLATMIEVLKSLGEKIRYENVASGDITAEVFSAVRRYEKESNDSLLDLNTSIPDDNVAIMQAYNIIVNLAYVARPKLYPFFVARWSNFF
jgi:hypothetical protein